MINLYNQDCLEAYEIDTDYFNAAVKRLEDYKLQLKLF